MKREVLKENLSNCVCKAHHIYNLDKAPLLAGRVRRVNLESGARLLGRHTSSGIKAGEHECDRQKRIIIGARPWRPIRAHATLV